MANKINQDGSNIFAIILQRFVEEAGMPDTTRMVFKDEENAPAMTYQQAKQITDEDK